MFTSLKNKISFGFIGITLLCIISITSLSIYEIKQIAINQMKNDGATIAAIVRDEISDYSIKKDLDKITVKLENIKSNSSGMSYISVIDKNATVVAHPDRSLVGQKLNKAQFPKVLEEGNIDGFMFERPTKEIVYNVSAPIKENGEIVGAVSVGISLENMNSIIQKTISVLIIVSIIILIIALLTGLLIAVNISKPLKTIKNKIKKLADGDFTLEFKAKSSDEIGQLMNTLDFVVKNIREMMIKTKNMANDLDNMSSKLSASSEEVVASADEVTNSAKEVSNSTANQNEYMREMTDSIENFGGSLDIIDLKLKNASQGTMNIKDSAKNGYSELEELTRIINEVRQRFLDTENRIFYLTENVSKISEITNVINAVAEQTNLLALNAAIEAARAGEAGSGFSIVAEEIRKLAEQVLESSKSINNIINIVSNNTQDVSNTTKEVSIKIDEQVKAAKVTEEVLGNILEEIEKIFPQVKNVYEALNNSVEEKNNILKSSKLISNSLSTITVSTEEIAATIDEQSSVNKDLSDLAEELKVTASNLNEWLEGFTV